MDQQQEALSGRSHEAFIMWRPAVINERTTTFALRELCGEKKGIHQNHRCLASMQQINICFRVIYNKKSHNFHE